ncbi:lipoate-protein ligase A [Halopenitus malekzadehii]|uniref:Lipoate-protein ligase A n=1 Tax=Halopenitus malekzadehii TaxID=1267564 RepID=A0A1H6HPZ3_9EURY|nr:biotin/lipoate A/B protein ligase family protein [Halopenitus malekzadehii]SEH37566.1 lipoate-protein ligase A [Halopenitus malekzadehii]
MDAPDGDWRLIREEARPGPMQMALDEVAADTAAEGGPWTVRVYRWDPSCLTMGYRQDPDSVDWEWCGANGVDVTRRQTGGGGIYHDTVGDIAYSIAVPADVVPGELLDCYHQLCEPILEFFSRIGVDADYVSESVPEIHHPACYLRELHPAHDVVAGPADDRRKIAGNAQYRRNDAVIQHGSLTFSVDAERHLGVFDDPPIDPEGFRDRVVGMDELVDLDRDDVVETLEETLAEWATASEGSWTDAELSQARERADEKYRSDSWVHEQPGSRS